jgi:translation elongation factor EF-Tu-like GTPase
MHRPPDCVAELVLAARGGKPSAAWSGYRPHVAVHENYQTTAVLEFVGVERVVPGEAAFARVWLLTPEVYPGCLWPGRSLAVFEGARSVGVLVIREVQNPVLAGDERAFNPVWSASASLVASNDG